MENQRYLDMQSMSKVWFHFGLQVETKDDEKWLAPIDPYKICASI